MLNFITSIVLASLLIPTGFNFLTSKNIDYSYINESQDSEAPTRIINDSFGLETTAESIIIIDSNSSSVLYQKNSNEVLSIASITKLMTALVVLDSNLDWQKSVVIQKEDIREGGISRVFPNETVTIEDLFNISLVASSNEATIALARNSGLEDFVSAMNKKAVEIGMENTYFRDPTGLEIENTSTAKDLIKLAQVAFSKQEIAEALSEKAYTFRIVNNRRVSTVESTDKLLESFLNSNGYKIIGAKTGYLNEAGYCLLFQVENAQGQKLTGVLLGTNSQRDRWQEAKGLVDWVFRNYQWVD